MRQPPRYILERQDSASAKVRRFGPFASEQIANEFNDELPEPLEGGSVKTVLVQPFTLSDAALVSEMILRERVH